MFPDYHVFHTLPGVKESSISEKCSRSAALLLWEMLTLRVSEVPPPTFTINHVQFSMQPGWAGRAKNKENLSTFSPSCRAGRLESHLGEYKKGNTVWCLMQVHTSCLTALCPPVALAMGTTALPQVGSKPGLGLSS